MTQVVIPNPVLNSPFDEPDRHFYFDEDGITEYTAAGKPRRVAVAIGPQYGTAGPDHI